MSGTFSKKYLVAGLLSMMALLFDSDAFVIRAPTDHRTFTTLGFGLYAKNTNKNKKKISRPRGGGRRGKQKKEDAVDDDENEIVKVSIPAPSKLRKIYHLFDRLQLNSTLRVCTVEIDDIEWWENADNDNPYGGKLWPSSLAISEFLVGMGNLEGYDVLELGCGVGLVSIVAGESGAHVVASDISPTITKLCKVGWLETQKNRQKQAQGRKKDDDKQDDSLDGTNVNPGTLNTLIFDLFSASPLPISASSSNRKVVIATAMMYDANLAAELAQRAFEACARGAWVILGDDDTGEREGGRQLFISELDKLEEEKDVRFQRTWIGSVVKSKSMQWSEKNVKVLHLNAPQDISLDASE